jgi:hypothetical protein
MTSKLAVFLVGIVALWVTHIRAIRKRAIARWRQERFKKGEGIFCAHKLALNVGLSPHSDESPGQPSEHVHAIRARRDARRVSHDFPPLCSNAVHDALRIHLRRWIRSMRIVFASNECALRVNTTNAHPMRIFYGASVALVSCQPPHPRSTGNSSGVVWLSHACLLSPGITANACNMTSSPSSDTPVIDGLT